MGNLAILVLLKHSIHCFGIFAFIYNLFSHLSTFYAQFLYLGCILHCIFYKESFPISLVSTFCSFCFYFSPTSNFKFHFFPMTQFPIWNIFIKDCLSNIFDKDYLSIYKGSPFYQTWSMPLFLSLYHLLSMMLSIFYPLFHN